MRAAVWHGKRDVRVDTVPDPIIKEPTDAIIKVTTSGLCGSDLHLYEVLAPFMSEGDMLGHEPMGIVEEVGATVHDLDPGDRVVVPSRSRAATASCATEACRRSARRPRSASTGWARPCSATRSCTAQWPAARPSISGCPRPSSGRSRFPRGPSTTASSTCPTSCRPRGKPSSTRRFPPGGSVAVLGLGPIGDMACRIARHRGAERVIGIDLVPERLERARAQRLRRRRRSTTGTNSSTPSARSPTGAALTRSSTPSVWRPTDRRSARRPTR